MGTNITKKILREQTLRRRLSLKPAEIKKASSLIVKKFKNLPEFKKAKSILFYIPIKNEIDTLLIIKECFGKKIVLVPKVYWQKMSAYKIESLEDLEYGAFNIPTAKRHCPIFKLSDIDIIVIPGIAFDKKMDRIGFGKGFYDKFLKRFKGLKIALAYDFQIIENIPGERYDEKVDIIVTPTKIIKPAS